MRQKEQSSDRVDKGAVEGLITSGPSDDVIVKSKFSRRQTVMFKSHKASYDSHSCLAYYLNTLKGFSIYIFSSNKLRFSGSNPFRTRSQGFGSMPNRERNRRSGPGLNPEPEPELGVRPGPVRVRTEVQNRTFPSLG